MTVTQARALVMHPPAGPTGLCRCSHSATSCTPSSTASRSPRIPSQRLSAIRSSGHAGQPSSRGAPTPSSTSCQCCLDPPLARLASLLAPWSPSRLATPPLTSSPSAVLATSCTALVWPSPWLRRLGRAVLRPRPSLVALASKCETQHETVDGSSYTSYTRVEPQVSIKQ